MFVGRLESLFRSTFSHKLSLFVSNGQIRIDVFLKQSINSFCLQRICVLKMDNIIQEGLNDY